MRALIAAALIGAFLGVARGHAYAESAPSSVGDWQTTVIRAAPPVGRGQTGPAIGSKLLTGALGRHALEGIASYYWHGETTASGEPFDKRAMTAAHPTLPFDSRVRVTDKASGKSVVVRINDRGPFVPGRVIDLSEAAAEAIGMTHRGLVPVRLEVLAGPDSAEGRR